MAKTNPYAAILGVFVLALSVSVADTETFGSGENQFWMEFVAIGDAGNSDDGTGYGGVSYAYSIGKYEVTVNQFTNALAEDSGIGDGDEDYWNDGTRTVGTNAPAVNVSVYEAMRFANWLTSGDSDAGAYQFNGSGTLTNINRDAAVVAYGTVYVVPTDDEWYKAAYWTGSDYTLYPTGDSAPTAGTDANYNNAVGSPWIAGSGAAENNATYDMGGNAWEWMEDAQGLAGYDIKSDNKCGLRGASYDENASWIQSGSRLDYVSHESIDVGFRVARLESGGTLVVLYRFDADVVDGRVVVRWMTASENATVGFRLYRKDVASGEWRVAREFVPAKGYPNGGMGAEYSVIDPDAVPGETCTYKLEELETDGGTQEYGPFERRAYALKIMAPFAVTDNGIVLRWLSRSNETYRIMCSTNLSPSAFGIRRSAIPATPPENVYTDALEKADAVFYRIEVDR